MTRWGYRILEKGAGLLGGWLLTLGARIIALGYFLFSPLRRESLRFYRLLFPGCSRLWPWYCTLRQYQHFTTIHSDRFLASHGRNIAFSSEGLELLDPCRNRQGALLLMSHLGNWELAAGLLGRQFADLRLLLYMGAKQKEGVEAAQKEALRRGGVRIIAMAAQDADPTGAVEGIRHLREGGVVAMPGDILLRPEQRHYVVPFPGGVARIPAAPFVMAWLAQAPIFVFFAFRQGACRYHFTLSPLPMPGCSRSERDQLLQQAAGHYVRLLEQAVRAHPFAWFHFRRFVHDRPAPLPGVFAPPF